MNFFLHRCFQGLARPLLSSWRFSASYFATASTENMRFLKERMLTSLEKRSDYFLEHYFSFSLECRNNYEDPRQILSPTEITKMAEAIAKDKQFLCKSVFELSWLTLCFSSRVRRARSGIEFLAEDIVKHEERLHMPWRSFLTFEVGSLEYTLHDFYDHVHPYFSSGDAGDMKNIPMNHNWWATWEREDSEEHYGPNLTEHLKNSPLVPAISLRPERSAFDESLYEFRSSEQFEQGIDIFRRYFDFSTKCRQYNLHPLAAYRFRTFPATRLAQVILHFDEVIHHLFENKDFSSDEAREVRLAIDFLDSELIPHIVEAKQPWEAFLTGNAMHSLDDGLKNSSQWWKTDEIKRVLCTLEAVQRAEKDSNLLDKLESFLCQYFYFAQECTMHSMDPREVFAEPERQEFLHNFPSVISALETINEVSSNNSVRKMRSAIEFLNEFFPAVDTSLRNEYICFLASDAMKKLHSEAMLQKPEENRWRAEDLRSISEQHVWWTKEERMMSEKEYGKSAWGIHWRDEEENKKNIQAK